MNAPIFLDNNSLQVLVGIESKWFVDTEDAFFDLKLLSGTRDSFERHFIASICFVKRKGVETAICANFPVRFPAPELRFLDLDFVVLLNLDENHTVGSKCS